MAHRKIAYPAISLMAFAAVAIALFFLPQTAHAQGCCSAAPGSCCLVGDCFYCNNGDPGGSQGPQPTTVYEPSPVPPQPGPTLPPGPTRPPAVCGDGVCTLGAESCTSCPGDCGVCPTPTPIPQGAVITLSCVAWPACPEGFADIDAIYNAAGDYWVVLAVRCKSRAECIRATATPKPTPPGGGGTQTWPCNYPPTVGGGVIHQPCSQWPGWDISAEAIIPPAAVMVNPWPRSLVGLPTYLWYEGASDKETFSDKALVCPGVDYGAIYTTSTFNCGGTVGDVGEGAKVNIQIGVAWRQWRRGGPAVFGFTPVDEASILIPDREWNGGVQMFTVGRGQQVAYTFQTSSWGLGPEGPSFRPACQNTDCTCDERVCQFRALPAYKILVQTWWWPEWTFKYDEYYCKTKEDRCEYRPGWGTTQCDLDGDGNPDPDTKMRHICTEWGWRQKMGYDLLPVNCAEPAGAWCRYDIRALGANEPMQGSTAVNTAGADAEGNQCTSRYYDYWPHSVPVPVIEVQPASDRWPTPEPPACP